MQRLDKGSSDEHSSLLLYGINYNRMKFYRMGPMGSIQKTSYNIVQSIFALTTGDELKKELLA